ncbi:hypothetical protein FRC02_011449 [Tulasnella sp. 418]|nr:hypothetical protein FRC02_011449 [Tulasnella sp. 418]
MQFTQDTLVNMSQSEDTRPAKYHEVLYISKDLQEGIYIQVEEILFCVPKFVLVQGCEGLADVFAACEGSPNSVTHPCVIPDLKVVEWEALVYYQCRALRSASVTTSFPERPALERYEALLSSASRFLAESARRHAIRALEDIPESVLRPARKLYLARRYHINEWLAPALRKIISMKAKDLSPEDIANLDADAHQTYLTITQTKEKIQEWQASLLFSTPPLQHRPQCHENAVCEATWTIQWRSYAMLLHYPQERMTTMDVWSKMTAANVPEAMGDCFVQAVNALSGSNFLTKESLLVDEAVTQISQIM